MGRHSFINEECADWKMNVSIGQWLRCKDNNEKTISDWLAAVECLKVVKKPKVMHINLYSCETSQNVEALQANMHITKNAASDLPITNETKRRRSDTSAAVVFVRTSSDPPLPPPAAPPIDDVLKVSSVTSVSPFHNLRCRVDAYVAHESLRHALPKLSF